MNALLIMHGVGWLGLLAFAAFCIHSGASPWWVIGGYEVRSKRESQRE